MTKLVSETGDNEKCNNCDDSMKKIENREIILKIIEDKLKSQESNQNECKQSDTDSEEGCVKCCSVCKRKYSPEMQKINSVNEKYRPNDTSTNNYGSINPVVVINIFKDEDQEEIEKSGVINEAFLNDDETKYDLKIIPEVEEENDGKESLKIENQTNKETTLGRMDKWRTASKRSMASVYSHNSWHSRTVTPSRRRSSALTSNASEKRRESLRNMIFGDPALCNRRFSQDLRSTFDKKEFVNEQETYKVMFLQVFVPFLVAGDKQICNVTC